MTEDNENATGYPQHPDDSRGDMWSIIDRRRCQDTLWPKWVTVHLTDLCNHHCDWCWYSRSEQSISPELLIDAINVLASKECSEITVSGGGEPLLYPAFSDVLEALALLPSIRKRLYTNGSLLGRFAASAHVFDYIRVSIDAGGSESYAKEHRAPRSVYHDTLELLGIWASRPNLVDVGISVVVHSRNVSNLPQLVQDCERYGINKIFLKPKMRGLVRESFPHIAELYSDSVRIHFVRDLGVYGQPDEQASSLAALLSTNDSIYPCCHLQSERFKIASLRDIRTHERAARVFGGPRHLDALRSYSSIGHPCRIHDAWLDQINWLRASPLET